MQPRMTFMGMANRIRSLMRWRGIRSQRQLARLSGVPQSAIARVLARCGDYHPQRKTIVKLAAALDTHPTWLTDGRDDTPAPSTAVLAPEQAELLHWVSYLAPEDHGAVLTLVRRLARKAPPSGT